MRVNDNGEIFDSFDENQITHLSGEKVSFFSLNREKYLVRFGPMNFLLEEGAEPQRENFQSWTSFSGKDSYGMETYFEFYKKQDAVAGFMSQNGFKMNFSGKIILDGCLENFGI